MAFYTIPSQIYKLVNLIGAFTVFPVSEVAIKNSNRNETEWDGLNPILYSYRYTYSDGYTTENPTIKLTKPDGTTVNLPYNQTSVINLDMLGTYRLSYSGIITEWKQEFGELETTLKNQRFNFYYDISIVENRLPFKKWTATSVINRLLDLCEPLRKGEKPRFILNEEQAAMFDKIPAPQFSLTRQTLRECLQEVGKVIHGESRLRIKKDSAGKYYYEVYYDMYASQEGTELLFKPYISKGAEWAINNYQTWVDSNAENLINQLDKLSGVIVEPYGNGAKTPRTESQYVRINEDNMLIATQYPIYTVDKLEYVYVADGEMRSVDITAYVFEKSEYDTRLSSYGGAEPYTKAYGLYFSQGSKNIGGLNFKVDAAAFASFKNYAIVNILKRAVGGSLPSYPLLSFRVTYTPYYNVRVAQAKTNYKDFKFPAALIYNQQSNVIESRYYGENLKGITARLGNVEKSLMYRFKTLGKVPKAGQLFGKDYYISAVAIELLPTYIRCTVGLSKDFNRISAYIGVPSEKRYYEISQRQAIDRNILWREYVVVGTEETPDSDSLLKNKMLEALAATFSGGDDLELYHITQVIAYGSSYQGNSLPAVDLPVISSAFGNSISLAWRYADNYSAGAMSQKVDNSLSGNITGYWQNDARYADYYGRIYYYNFALYSVLPKSYSVQDALNLPAIELPKTNQDISRFEQYQFISTKAKPFILRKDNREALQVNYQIDFVTNSNIIIGSALASNCPAVRGGTIGRARLYVLPTELHKFTDHIEGWEDVELDKIPYVEVTTTPYDGNFAVTASPFPANGKSWAIVTPQTDGVVEQVEDEQGNQYEHRETYGGNLLIGKNEEISAGQAFTPIYFTPKREVFDKSVWKSKI